MGVTNTDGFLGVIYVRLVAYIAPQHNPITDNRLSRGVHILIQFTHTLTSITDRLIQNIDNIILGGLPVYNYTVNGNCGGCLLWGVRGGLGAGVASGFGGGCWGVIPFGRGCGVLWWCPLFPLRGCVRTPSAGVVSRVASAVGASFPPVRPCGAFWRGFVAVVGVCILRAFSCLIRAIFAPCGGVPFGGGASVGGFGCGVGVFFFYRRGRVLVGVSVGGVAYAIPRLKKIIERLNKGVDGSTKRVYYDSVVP